MKDDTSVRNTAEPALCPRGKPFGLERTALAGTQPAHRTVELSFEIVSPGIAVVAKRGHSVAAQPHLRAVCPKDNRGFAGIGFFLFILKTFNHSVAALTIDNRDPTCSRVQP